MSRPTIHPGEILGDELAELGIVVDNQHAFHGEQTPFILKPRCAVPLSRCVKRLTDLDDAWHFWTAAAANAFYSRT